MTSGGRIPRLLLIIAITGVEVAIGRFVVPTSSHFGWVGGCRCTNYYPTWFWPAMWITFLSLGWLACIGGLFIRPLRRARQTAEGRRRAPSPPIQSVSRGREAEGWYEDPFRRHQHRWISKGSPTALVRDGGVEAQDPPPESFVADRMVPALPSPSLAPNRDDLRRVGDKDSGVYDPNAATDAVLDATTWFPIN